MPFKIAHKRHWKNVKRTYGGKKNVLMKNEKKCTNFADTHPVQTVYDFRLIIFPLCSLKICRLYVCERIKKYFGIISNVLNICK